MLGLADRGDRNVLKDSAKQDISQLSNEIQMLMPGEALITSPFTPFAIPVKIHLYEEYLETLDLVPAEGKDESNSGNIDRETDDNFF